MLSLISGSAKNALPHNKRIMETKTLQLSPVNARKMYQSMPEMRPSLEDTFGTEFFRENIIDKIKTYEDACAELGITPQNDRTLLELGFTPDEINLRKIKTITAALNEGWKPDWNDGNQYKYFPWFKMSSGAFVFGDAYYAGSDADAGSAARLCFKSKELAKYAGEQFTKLCSDYILY